MFIVVLCCVAATALGGCGQTSDMMTDIKDSAFTKPAKFFSVPSWAKPNRAANDFNLMPKGPVKASNLISAGGHCAPAPVPATPPAAQKPPQAAAQVSAPPPDRLEPAGSGAGFAAPAPVFGGVSLGMSECAVARRLGTPGNVSISRSPKGKRRVVLIYNGGDRPGVYSFLSGRLIQVDATPQQTKRYDRRDKKPGRTRRTRDQMYVQ